MKPYQISRLSSVAMLLLGLGGAVYSAVEWIFASPANTTRYEILFVMWLVLGIGWGSRLLPNAPARPQQAHDGPSNSKTHA